MSGIVYYRKDILDILLKDAMEKTGLAPTSNNKPCISIDGMAPLRINNVDQELRITFDTSEWVMPVSGSTKEGYTPNVSERAEDRAT